MIIFLSRGRRARTPTWWKLLILILSGLNVGQMNPFQHYWQPTITWKANSCQINKTFGKTFIDRHASSLFPSQEEVLETNESAVFQIGLLRVHSGQLTLWHNFPPKYLDQFIWQSACLKCHSVQGWNVVVSPQLWMPRPFLYFTSLWYYHQWSILHLHLCTQVKSSYIS